jgi:chemotaxis protein MotB
MAKKDDSGETVLPGKGRSHDLRPSPAPRRFPFRLLLWAILMTGAAGAGGYYAWKFREDAVQQKADARTCGEKLAPAEALIAAKSSELTSCTGNLATMTTRQEEIDAQLEQVSKNLNATQDELGALRAQRAETEKRIAAIEKIQQQFAKMIDTGELKVTSRRGSLVVELPSEVLFPSASAKLSRKGEVAVLQVGGILKQFDDRRFVVIGHTDSAPLKSTEYQDNWELSVARALTVTRFLVEGGMRPANLLAAGSGDHDPIAENKSSEGRARNRRIEIALLPAVQELPPLPASLEEAGKEAEKAGKPADKKDDKKSD